MLAQRFLVDCDLRWLESHVVQEVVDTREADGGDKILHTRDIQIVKVGHAAVRGPFLSKSVHLGSVHTPVFAGKFIIGSQIQRWFINWWS